MAIFIVNDQRTDITNESNTGYFIFVEILVSIGVVASVFGFSLSVYQIYTEGKNQTETDDKDEMDVVDKKVESRKKIDEPTKKKK
jgi:hypothetical protein